MCDAVHDRFVVTSRRERESISNGTAACMYVCASRVMPLYRVVIFSITQIFRESQGRTQARRVERARRQNFRMI